MSKGDFTEVYLATDIVEVDSSVGKWAGQALGYFHHLVVVFRPLDASLEAGVAQGEGDPREIFIEERAVMIAVSVIIDMQDQCLVSPSLLLKT